jgi:hypothetical protein
MCYRLNTAATIVTLGVSQSSQSTGGSSFVPHRSEDRQEIEMLKESLRQWDKAMW